MRNLVINNETWTYKVGNKFIVIKSPTNKRVNLELSTLKGISQDNIERGRNVVLCDICSGACELDIVEGSYQKRKNGMVTPSEVRKVILANQSMWC